MRRRASALPAARRTAGAGRNRVRIIGGELRSRLVRFPADAPIRPTPDRVRETLFNWLGQRLDGLACLDLFAGSGALGFEAVSRGASRVVMVERDRAAAAALRENAAELGATRAEIVQGESIAWLASGTDRFDVVFLDPPYASDLLEAALAKLTPRLNPGARVYVEADASREFAPPWVVRREARAGAVRYALIERTDP